MFGELEKHGCESGISVQHSENRMDIVGLYVPIRTVKTDKALQLFCL